MQSQNEKLISATGIIEFEPPLLTNKHINHADWRKVAMVNFDGDIVEYYNWFLRIRFGLQLNKLLRGPHVSFINDDFQRDTTLQGTREEKEAVWEQVKEKWNGKEIEVVFHLDIHTNGKHWWLNVDYEHREELHQIRTELGLGHPYAGLHLTLGHVNEKNLGHSQHLFQMYLNDRIELNDSLYWKKLHGKK